jgi:hypothetical protein
MEYIMFRDPLHQRLCEHKNRKIAAAKKEQTKYLDGKGKKRVKASQVRAKKNADARNV